MKTILVALFIICLAPMAKAERFPHYFGQGATYKLVKGSKSCPAQAYLDAFPSTGLRINGEEIGETRAMIGGIFGENKNPFAGGTTESAVAKISTESCRYLGRDCNTLETTYLTDLYLNEDFRQIVIERKVKKEEVGPGFHSKIEITPAFKCQYKQIK